MRPYVEWLKSDEFYIKEDWDEEKQMMVGAGTLKLREHQERILSTALAFKENGTLKYETVLYSCVKKSGKTAIAASIGAWYAECAPPYTEIYCIANDLDSSAGRVFSDIRYHYQMRIENHDEFDMGNGNKVVLTDKNCKLSLYKIELPNGTFIHALAQSFRSVAGSRHSLTLWDELWGVMTELTRRTWDEMVPIPTVQNSLRFIATYAGFENESDLLWDKYIQGVGKEEREEGRGTAIGSLDGLPCWENGKQFTYWDTEPRMPWQTEEYYDEARKSERPAAFLRLHQNQWVTSQEEFIPLEWLNHAFKQYKAPANLWEDHPFKGYPLTVAIDAGQKRDSTALVAVGYDSKEAKLGVVHHKIWVPQPGDPVDLDATVEQELIEMNKKFKVVSVVYDPTHLIQTMIRLKRKGLPVREFTQTVPNMVAASQLLFDLFKNRRIYSYYDEELFNHLRMAVAETTSRGFRIVKSKVSRRQKIDGAIALAMACYDSVQNGGVDISIPVIIRSPWEDRTAWSNDYDQQDIPFELRTN